MKQRKLQEFLDKGKTVAVAVTYDQRAKTWQEQYPRAVEVRPPLLQAASLRNVLCLCQVPAWVAAGHSERS